MAPKSEIPKKTINATRRGGRLLLDQSAIASSKAPMAKTPAWTALSHSSIRSSQWP